MIPKYLSATWAAIAPAAGNHLWQSTLCVVIAGLLTLILRKNHARARYGLWLAASVKFLIPFSLLVNIGSHLPWSHGPAGMQTGLYIALEQVSQPFTPPTPPVISPVAHSTFLPNLVHLLPAILVAVWLCGFVVVLCVWYVRWRRISAAIREAVPLRKGREVEALRRAERLGGIQTRIELLLSPATLEPGIFGIARPVLVWPKGISAHLQDAHLEAILAHELWHVRRRDNLAAAIHMVVEAIFWFHPLVWWLGARLVEERERACDEEILELGSERQVYAESILKICEFCVGSPLACVAGVTGADLKKRIVRIMTERVARKLDFGRKLLLSAAGLVAVAVPVVFGLLQAAQSRAESQAQNTAAIAPVYEVASIKPNKSGSDMTRLMFPPNGLTATNVTLHGLIGAAYGVSQISGAPNWLNSEKYDVEAKVNSSVADELRKLSFDQRVPENQRMLQALLADRFKLTLHRETKELAIYALVISKKGPKLQKSKPGDTYPNGLKGPDGSPGGADLMEVRMGQISHIIGQALPISRVGPGASLVRPLSQQLGRTVLDKTGLKGNYDFTLQWTPDQSQAAMVKGSGDGKPGSDNAPPPESSAPSLFTAIQEQLGLKLESQNAPVEILVIDHVEKPSGN